MSYVLLVLMIYVRKIVSRKGGWRRPTIIFIHVTVCGYVSMEYSSNMSSYKVHSNATALNMYKPNGLQYFLVAWWRLFMEVVIL